MRNALIAIVVAALIATGIYFIFIKKDNSSSNTSSTAQTQSSTPTQTQPTQAPASVTVTYGSSGFNPGMVTVKSGGTVTVLNDSSTAVQFQSDPHPTHTDDPELNIGTIDSGKTKTFTVTTTGTHGYHNHLNPTEIGTIVVK